MPKIFLCWFFTSSFFNYLLRWLYGYEDDNGDDDEDEEEDGEKEEEEDKEDFKAPVLVHNAMAWTINPIGRVVENWNILAYASNLLMWTNLNNSIENVLLKITLYNELLEHKNVIVGFRVFTL